MDNSHNPQIVADFIHLLDEEAYRDLKIDAPQILRVLHSSLGIDYAFLIN
jgi:hypothetical protein